MNLLQRTVFQFGNNPETAAGDGSVGGGKRLEKGIYTRTPRVSWSKRFSWVLAILRF